MTAGYFHFTFCFFTTSTRPIMLTDPVDDVYRYTILVQLEDSVSYFSMSSLTLPSIWMTILPTLSQQPQFFPILPTLS